jgi:hypothetical protein
MHKVDVSEYTHYGLSAKSIGPRSIPRSNLGPPLQLASVTIAASVGDPYHFSMDPRICASE